LCPDVTSFGARNLDPLLGSDLAFDLLLAQDRLELLEVLAFGRKAEDFAGLLAFETFLGVDALDDGKG